MLNYSMEQQVNLTGYEPKNDIEYTYIIPIVSAIGFILNLLNFLVFSSSSLKELLYKYLKMESLNILLDLLISSFKPIYDCKTCKISQTYIAQIYFIGLIDFGSSVLELSASFNRIISTFCCLMLIKNKLKKFRALSIFNYYKAINVIIFLTSSFIFLYKIFLLDIVHEVSIEPESNKIRKKFFLKPSKFSATILKPILEMSTFFLRDCFNLTISIILNIFILNNLKINLSKKIILSKSIRSNVESVMESGKSHDKEFQKSVNVNIKKCEKKQTIMMVISCFVYIIGRVPFFIFVVISYFYKIEKSQTFLKIAVLCLYISYTLNFFLYYLSNKRYKKQLKKIFSNFSNFIFKMVNMFRTRNFI